MTAGPSPSLSDVEPTALDVDVVVPRHEVQPSRRARSRQAARSTERPNLADVPTVSQLPHEPFLEPPPPGAGFRWRLGLRPLDLDDWFDDGPDAAGWIAEKEAILAAHHATAFAVLDGIEPEAREIAAAVRAHRRASGVTAELRDDVHPLEAASRLVAEDLVLMVERDGRLVFGGGSVCFPNRWDLRSKLGRSLREVHAPVPLLDEQLGEPVDRFLARLTPERGYWRLGWGIIDAPDGYAPVDGTVPGRSTPAEPGDLYVRVERETLRRFPAPTASCSRSARTSRRSRASRGVRRPPRRSPRRSTGCRSRYASTRTSPRSATGSWNSCGCPAHRTQKLIYFDSSLLNVNT